MVDWLQPLSKYMSVNVDSKHTILRLISYGKNVAGRYIPTESVLPRHLGFTISGDEGELEYATFDWIAVYLVSAARWRGVKASVYRLSYVSASSTRHFHVN